MLLTARSCPHLIVYTVALVRGLARGTRPTFNKYEPSHGLHTQIMTWVPLSHVLQSLLRSDTCATCSAGLLWGYVARRGPVTRNVHVAVFAVVYTVVATVGVVSVVH